ncbi:ferredoxin [Rhodococcus koreensis]
MKAVVDSTKCAGYGACADICPEVFEIDEFGYAALIGDGTVPAGREDAADKAIKECPERAITLQN